MSAAHEYTPDWGKWWEDSSSTKETFAWVILGIDPDTAKRVEELSRKTDATDEEKVFIARFDNFSVLNGYITLRTLWARYRLLQNLDWGKGKEEFLYNAYAAKFTIHKDFKIYLHSIGKMPHDPNLERYTMHEQYRADLKEWNVANIQDEDTALSLLLGLQPKHFIRIQALEERQKTGVLKDGFAPRAWQFSDDEKWFYDEYLAFLREEFPYLRQKGYGTIMHALAPLVRDAKCLATWQGSFKEYVQELHDNGLVLMPKIYDSLQVLGVAPSYSSQGWAVQFYKRWASYPTWSLKQAADLYLGTDPDKSQSFIYLGDRYLHGSGAGFALESDETIAEYDYNGKFIQPPDDNFDHIFNDEPDPHAPRYLLESFVRSHMDAGHIKAVKDDGPEKLYFKPEIIVDFFKNYLGRTYRPEALYMAMAPETEPKPKRSRGRPAGSGIDDSEAISFIEQKMQNEGSSQHKAANDAYATYKKGNESFDTFAGRIRRKMGEHS